MRSEVSRFTRSLATDFWEQYPMKNPPFYKQLVWKDQFEAYICLKNEFHFRNISR